VIVGLASPSPARDLDDGLAKIDRLLSEVVNELPAGA